MVNRMSQDNSKAIYPCLDRFKQTVAATAPAAATANTRQYSATWGIYATTGQYPIVFSGSNLGTVPETVQWKTSNIHMRNAPKHLVYSIESCDRFYTTVKTRDAPIFDIYGTCSCISNTCCMRSIHLSCTELLSYLVVLLHRGEICVWPCLGHFSTEQGYAWRRGRQSLADCGSLLQRTRYITETSRENS